MTTEELKAEIAKAEFSEGIKISTRFDEFFNVYEIVVKFPLCECQIMYLVKPLGIDGKEIAEELYFSTIKSARWFMNQYRKFYSIDGWLAMNANHYSKWICQSTLYYARKEKKGGQQ